MVHKSWGGVCLLLVFQLVVLFSLTSCTVLQDNVVISDYVSKWNGMFPRTAWKTIRGFTHLKLGTSQRFRQYFAAAPNATVTPVLTVQFTAGIQIEVNGQYNVFLNNDIFVMTLDLFCPTPGMFLMCDHL
jgi:hypothetical protein